MAFSFHFPFEFPAKAFFLALRSWPVILASVFVILIDLFDSFGLDQAADEQVARMIGTAQAPFYGGADRIGQQSVLVVLIDDATIAHFDWPTPPNYADQAEIAAALAFYQPAAIFFDFSYLRPHGEDAALEIENFRDRIKAYADGGGFPIMIGDVGEHEALAPLRELTSVGVRWRAQSWLDYPMWNDDNEDGVEMAASALYRAWCDRHQARCQAWRPRRDDQLAITWGFGTSPRSAEINAREDDEICVMKDTGVGTRLGFALREGLRSFGRAVFYDEDRGDPAEARCIYADTINAATLLTAPEEILQDLVEGRVVLVGASHRESGDLQTIPHVGMVPGVFVHAMAVDNLIEQGSDYTRPPPEGLLALDLGDALEILLSVILFAMVWFMSKAIKARAAQGGRSARALWPLLTIGYVVVGVLFVVGAVALELALHWPPLNIVGVILLIALVFNLFDRHLKNLARADAQATVTPQAQRH